MGNYNFKRIKRGLSSTALLVIGNGIYALAQWSFILSLTRITGPASTGAFSLALGISAPLFLLFGLQLRVVQATDISNNFTFPTYLATRFLGMLVALILSIIAAFYYIYVASFGFEFIIIVTIVSLIKLVEGFSDLAYGVFQKLQLFLEYSCSLIYRGLLSGILFAVILYFTNSLLVSLLSVLASYVIIALLYDYNKLKPLLIHDGLDNISIKNGITKLIKLTTALGFAAVLDSLIINVQRYIISTKLGLTDLGLYTPVVQLIIIAHIIISALAQYFLPKLAAVHYNNSRTFLLLGSFFTLISMFIGFIGLIVAYVWGNSILTLFYGQDYSDQKSVFIIVAIGAIFWYGAGAVGTMLTAAQKYKYHLIANTGAVISALVFSIILIPSLQLIGAAWALAIAYITRFTISVFGIISSKYRESDSFF